MPSFKGHILNILIAYRDIFISIADQEGKERGLGEFRGNGFFKKQEMLFCRREYILFIKNSQEGKIKFFSTRKNHETFCLYLLCIHSEWTF